MCETNFGVSAEISDDVDAALDLLSQEAEAGLWRSYHSLVGATVCSHPSLRRAM